MNHEAEKFNDMQLAKRRLFAMRNGVVADALKKGGCPFSVVFGVNLPQLKYIAAELPHTVDLAEQLWNNSTTRESMLLAPMLYPPEDFTMDKAKKWIAKIPSAETADILCHTLLRKEPYAEALAEELSSSNIGMERYTGLRLAFNMVSKNPQNALKIAEAAMKSSVWIAADRLASALADEARYILGYE